MQPPDEMMVENFLPALRLLVAKRLRAQGYSQSRIAAVLGVTQASVSLYLSSDAGRAYSSLADFSIGKEEAERYAAVLAEDAKRSATYAVETLGSIWSSLLGRGLACDAHRRAYPLLANCEVCVESRRQIDERSGTITEVALAVKAIESSAAFVSAMPEVSVNLACVSGESDQPEDIVAVPGRIVRVRNSARALRQPEFGASRHMSRMLLLARTRRKDLRAAINLRYDKRMSTVLRKLHLRVLEVGEYPDSGVGDPTLDALARRLVDARGNFDAIVDAGGRGIEPNVYLFGKDAVDVARLAIRASELYSAS